MALMQIKVAAPHEGQRASCELPLPCAPRRALGRAAAASRRRSGHLRCRAGKVIKAGNVGCDGSEE